MINNCSSASDQRRKSVRTVQSAGAICSTISNADSGQLRNKPIDTGGFAASNVEERALLADQDFPRKWQDISM